VIDEHGGAVRRQMTGDALPIPVAAPMSIATFPASCLASACSDSLLKPVVERDRRVLAELGGEALSPRSPLNSPVPEPGTTNHPPLTVFPSNRAGVLKQKRAGPALEATGDALDSNEARRPVLAHRLQEVDDSLALDVAAEGLGDLDLDEVRPLVDLFVGLCLVRLYSTRPVACVLLASFTGSPFLSALLVVTNSWALRPWPWPSEPTSNHDREAEQGLDAIVYGLMPTGRRG
jgi:hypothetical protein